LFGFEARTPLREGLEQTIAWYREHAGATTGARS
jgi:nucleoside-diphosphate-sugar epimerase